MGSKRAFFIVIAAIMLASTPACNKKSKNGNFTLQLKAVYGNQSFSMDSFYTDPAGRVLAFNQFFQFYLSHITLVKTDGSVDTVSDVSFFNLGDQTALSISLNNINGNFKAISFACGIDSVQNLTNPNAVPLSDPLNENYGMFWIMFNNYQFEIVQGKWDTAEIPVMRNPILYHIGLNPQYRYATLNQNFSVCCDNSTTLTLTLDVKKIFYAAANTLSIEESTQMGTEDNPAVGPAFATNFANAFSVSQ